MYFSGAVSFDQFSCSTDGATRANHVIKHQGNFAFDRPTDNGFLPDSRGTFPAFVDDGNGAADAFRMAYGSLDAPLVGTHYHKIFAPPTLPHKVVGEDA